LSGSMTSTVGRRTMTLWDVSADEAVVKNAGLLPDLATFQRLRQ
jgi:hypothetical protein